MLEQVAKGMKMGSRILGCYFFSATWPLVTFREAGDRFALCLVMLAQLGPGRP